MEAARNIYIDMPPSKCIITQVIARPYMTNMSEANHTVAKAEKPS